MPQVIQFTKQTIDYGVERLLPEKVHKVRASVLDSRFMTTHGRYCIVADDNDFVTHVGIELGESASFYAARKLGWNFMYYNDPLLKKEEEHEEGAAPGTDPEAGESAAGEGDDGGGEEPVEPQPEGTSAPEEDAGEEGGEEAPEDEDAVTEVITPPMPAEHVEVDMDAEDEEEELSLPETSPHVGDPSIAVETPDGPTPKKKKRGKGKKK